MEIGTKSTSTIVVTEQLTAAVMGSGDLPVLATPAMIALMENAAMMAVAPALPEDQTTVGSLMNASHLKPTAVGDTVVATATLVAVEGRKLTYRVEAHDSEGLIGEGDHVRYIVGREKFLAKLKK